MLTGELCIIMGGGYVRVSSKVHIQMNTFSFKFQMLPNFVRTLAGQQLVSIYLKH